MAEADQFHQRADVVGLPPRPGLFDPAAHQLFDRPLDHPAADRRAAAEAGRVDHPVLVAREVVRHPGKAASRAAGSLNSAFAALDEFTDAGPAVGHQRQSARRRPRRRPPPRPRRSPPARGRPGIRSRGTGRASVRRRRSARPRGSRSRRPRRPGPSASLTSARPSLSASALHRGPNSSAASIAAITCRTEGRAGRGLVILRRAGLGRLADGERGDLHVPPAGLGVDLAGVDLELPVARGLREAGRDFDPLRLGPAARLRPRRGRAGGSSRRRRTTRFNSRRVRSPRSNELSTPTWQIDRRARRVNPPSSPSAASAGNPPPHAGARAISPRDRDLSDRRQDRPRPLPLAARRVPAGGVDFFSTASIRACTAAARVSRRRSRPLERASGFAGVDHAAVRGVQPELPHLGHEGDGPLVGATFFGGLVGDRQRGHPCLRERFEGS